MSKKGKKKQSIYLIVLLLVLAALSVFLVKRTGSESEISLQSGALDIPFSKQGTLIFTSQQSGDSLALIDIELADNDQLRARGLMYRSALPENAGMLFIQQTEEMQSFWMKNTYIPLDILFVNSNREIVTIHANTTPLKEWSYASTQPALYVVEVNAGFCGRHGIRTGDKIAYIILP